MDHEDHYSAAADVDDNLSVGHIGGGGSDSDGGSGSDGSSDSDDIEFVDEDLIAFGSEVDKLKKRIPYIDIFISELDTKERVLACVVHLGRICSWISKALEVNFRELKLISTSHLGLANESFPSRNLKSELELKEDVQRLMHCLEDKCLVGLERLFNSGKIVDQMLSSQTVFMMFISAVSKLEHRIPEILASISESVTHENYFRCVVQIGRICSSIAYSWKAIFGKELLTSRLLYLATQNLGLLHLKSEMVMKEEAQELAAWLENDCLASLRQADGHDLSGLLGDLSSANTYIDQLVAGTGVIAFYHPEQSTVFDTESPRLSGMLDYHGRSTEKHPM